LLLFKGQFLKIKRLGMLAREYLAGVPKSPRQPKDL
jgi:hypothetical protein